VGSEEPVSNSEAGTGSGLAEGPAARLSAYLSDRGVEHEIIEHAKTVTALAEAHQSEVPADNMAKPVLLSEADTYVLAVVPASRRLDLDRTRDLIGREGLRLATEAELAVLGPNVEVGALPILGPDVPATELLDQRLLEHERITCSAGDHRHAVSFPPGALLELMDPIVADICEG
jgi:Ala-tRNA(Pro) deacylase